MPDKKYTVDVQTKVDSKQLDNLLKKIQAASAKIDVGVNVDSKTVKSIQKDLDKLFNKGTISAKIDLNTKNIKDDLSQIERQLKSIDQLAKGIKIPGGTGMAGGVSGTAVAGGTTTVVQPQIQGGGSLVNTAANIKQLEAQSTILQKITNQTNNLNDVKKDSNMIDLKSGLINTDKMKSAVESGDIKTVAALLKDTANNWKNDPQNPQNWPEEFAKERKEQFQKIRDQLRFERMQSINAGEIDRGKYVATKPTPTFNIQDERSLSQQKTSLIDKATNYVDQKVSKLTEKVSNEFKGQQGFKNQLVGMEVFEKANFIIQGAANKYAEISKIYEKVDSEKAKSYKELSEQLKNIGSTTQAAVAGMVLLGPVGGAAAGGIAYLTKALTDYMETMAEVAIAEQSTVDIHRELSDNFKEGLAQKAIKDLEKYNDTLDHTIRLEQEATAAKLFGQDEELARAYDLLNQEKRRIQNQKTLINDSKTLTDTQKIVQTAALDKQLIDAQKGYDIAQADAPLRKAQTSIAGISDTLTSVVESITKVSGDYEKVKKFNEALSELDTKLENATRKFNAAQNLPEDNSSRAGLLRMATDERNSLMAQKEALKKQMRGYGTEEQLQAEIQSLQTKRDAIQNQIIAAEQQLQFAVETRARVLKNISETYGLDVTSLGIEKVSNLGKTTGSAAYQSRAESGTAELLNRIGNIGGLFDRLREGGSFAKTQGLNELERVISESVKDGVMSVKEFNTLNRQAVGLGVAGDAEMKKLLNMLYAVAKSQIGVGESNLAPLNTEIGKSNLPENVKEFVAQITKDNEITADELAKLVELQQQSGLSNSDALNRLVAIAEQTLSGTAQLEERIKKIESALRVTQAKLK